MADAYLDHGAYASALGTTPTWGVPQEGDGTNKDAATASSIASVVFASVPTTGTISVCGVSISTTGVLAAANVDAAANALASNINATTTAVGSTVARGVPQLRNLVFARGPSGGAPAGTCQIMMRVGSTSLNHATNSNVAIAQTLSPSATLTQFAGGSGGCWGWFVNPAAIGVGSTIAARTYGLLVNQPLVAGGGYAFAELDRVFVRTGRNTTISIGPLFSDFTSLNTKPGFVNLVFDTNTVWTSDGTNGVLRMNIDNTASSFVVGFGTGGGETPKFHTYKALALGGYTIGFSFVNGSTFEFDSNNTGAGYAYEKVRFIEMGTTGGNAGWQFQGTNTTIARRALIDCELDFSACQRVDLRSPTFRLRQGSLTLIGNSFIYNLTGVGGAALAVPLVGTTDASVVGGDLTMRGNRAVIGQPGELRAVQFNAGGSAGAGFIATGENNRGIGLAAGSAGILNTTSQPSTAVLSWDNLAVGGGAHFEDRRGYWQWVPGQPVLSAQAPDGTVWSWIGFWTNAAQMINPTQPMVSPAARIQSRLATGVRTLTLELLLDSVALAALPTDGRIELSYVDNTGLPRCDRLPISLVASSATWTNVSGAPYNTWVARKCTVSTSQQVPLNSILNVRIYIDRRLEGGSTAAFAWDPEPAIS